MGEAMEVASLTSRSELLEALTLYRDARRRFLAVLGCDNSNRDPLAEFAERIAAAVLGGELARSRVQKGYDLITLNGQKVQVRYLANPAGTWVNEHVVDFRHGVDLYALLVVEALDAKCLLVFARDNLANVCSLLGKRHPNQHETLQFTRANYQSIIAAPTTFAVHGVTIVRLSPAVS